MTSNQQQHHQQQQQQQQQPQNDTSTKEQMASHYALHVALQTMKERCMSLQQRLTAVEEENLTLRMQHGLDTPSSSSNSKTDQLTEMDLLREKVGELTRQKYQLTEHISMVASENRQLWSRLSKLTKDNQTLGISLNKIKDTLNTSTNIVSHQNLIRSKTFTQSSPNPMLRQKLQHSHTVADVLGGGGVGGDGHDDCGEHASLEEISLKDYTDSGADVTLKAAANSLGFGYLNDESINSDLQNETKKCLDGMIDIKRELLRQQSDLKVALSGLRQRRVLELCLNCKNHNSNKKTVTADKNTGTADDEDLIKPNRTNLDYDEQNEHMDNAFMPLRTDQVIHQQQQLPPTKHIDILQQKRIADQLDKMCPMCGKIYSSSSSFELFQDHVESHFIDDSDLDLSIEKNYELISNSVGNF